MSSLTPTTMKASRVPSVTEGAVPITATPTTAPSIVRSSMRPRRSRLLLGDRTRPRGHQWRDHEGGPRLSVRVPPSQQIHRGEREYDFAALVEDLDASVDQAASGLERERRASRIVVRMERLSPGRTG